MEKEIFDAAETDNMANEELVEYSQSLQKLHDIQSGLEYARQESFNDGRAEGRAEGLRESAINMLKSGIDPVFIHEITGLPISEIKSL